MGDGLVDLFLSEVLGMDGGLEEWGRVDGTVGVQHDHPLQLFQFLGDVLD